MELSKIDVSGAGNSTGKGSREWSPRSSSTSREKQVSPWEIVESNCYRIIMECNKEESLRAKRLAEEKLEDRDFAGAKRFLLKATKLFPSLEGLSQMLPVIDIQIYSQQTVGDGETDWYGILQLDEEASDAAIKSQYQKLALTLHPDRNNAVGADIAFQLVRDAWNVLSDTRRKLLHDSKRRNFRSNPSNASTSSEVDPSWSSRQRSPKKPNSSNQEGNRRGGEAQMEDERDKRKEGERKTETEKLVRKENAIKRQNEKERKQNKTRQEVKEVKRKKPRFQILEHLPPPPPIETASRQQLKKKSEYVVKPGEVSLIDRLKQRNGTWAQQRDRVRVDLSDEQGSEVKPRHEHVPDIVTTEEEDSEGEKQARKRRRKRNLTENESKDGECCASQKKTGDLPTNMRDKKHQVKYEEEKQYFPFISPGLLKSERIFSDCTHYLHDLSPVKQNPYEPESENLLTVLSQKVVRVEMKAPFYRQTRGSEVADEGQESEQREMFSLSNCAFGKTFKNSSSEDERKNLRADTVVSDSKIEVKEATVHVSTRKTRENLREEGKRVFGTEEVEGNVLHLSRANNWRSNPVEGALQHLVGEFMEVSPSQFNNFDGMRKRRAFRTGQIWAVYDDNDGMPRFYCRLTRVSGFSLPFKARFSWLEPTSKTQLKNLKFWAEDTAVEVGCGEFEAGKTAVTEHINIFSRCVFENFQEDPVEIYPLKGEIWAVFQGMNYIRTMEGTGTAAGNCEDVGSSYELVEILEDFGMQRGVPTVRLVHVPRFRYVFCMQKGPDAFQCFSPSQVPVFSHRILSWKIPGLGLLGEAWELDPASIPQSLLVCCTL